MAEPFMSSGPRAIDLARYRLLRPLGRGGMGEVHLAEDQVLHRLVAIKFVAPDKITDPEARTRLLHEAQSAAGLDHEGICTVYEAGPTTDGRDCIVMQYVEGDTLETILEAGPLDVPRALDLCLHVAEALAVAHRHRVIHRDLKPGNIIVTASGRPKLLDFGIAKVVPPADMLENASTVSGVTTKGRIVGTPAYMSPEQILERPVDGRSDLFALGVVLYECLTGRRAFAGPTTFETIANVIHVDPPAPSTLRPELNEVHDRLCYRLLAKNPAGRFQTAEEVVGALRFASSDPQGKTGPQPDATTAAPPPFLRGWPLLATATALLLVLAGGWWLTRPTPLPAVPDDAAWWYQKGTEAIREGAYLTARTALTEAIKLFPEHVLAYARLAEADAELDDERAAQGHLLRVSALVPDESRLPYPERLRLQAVRALVLRDVDKAVALYRELAEREPESASAWVDLGRAQESAGRRTDARASYERAITKDRQYAVAYLRLGSVEGLESRHREALDAFKEAERLYDAASDQEGRTELLLHRGSMLDAFDELKPARADLERALALAESTNAVHQVVRSRLALSSVMASEGALESAERLSTTAVRDALAAGLDTIAADGLIDLAYTLTRRNRTTEADATLQRALQLAEQRRAGRTAARARLQLASLRGEENRHRETLEIVESVLPFLKANRYRRYELTALSIASRAHERLDELAQAQALSATVLQVADSLKDDGAVALAAANLASVTTELGQLPQALRLRERAEAIHRRQGNAASLPYDLANRAELLVRVGRGSEAAVILAELDAGIAAGLEAYVGRRRRVHMIRGLAEATALRCDQALGMLARVEAEAVTADYSGVIGQAISEFCRAHSGRSHSQTQVNAAGVEPALDRERRYWLGLAALHRNEPDAVVRNVDDALRSLGGVPNDELRWRLAALGVAATRQIGDKGRRTAFVQLYVKALNGVRTGWKGEAPMYEKRPDLVALRRRVEP